MHNKLYKNSINSSYRNRRICRCISKFSFLLKKYQPIRRGLQAALLLKMLVK